MTDNSLLSLLALTIDGQAPPKALADSIEQILVETSLHLPSVATLVIHDPGLVWIDNGLLEPGKTLKIAGEGGAALFDGEIIEIEAELGVEGQRVFVRAFDKLHRLARGAHSRAFTQVSDSDLVKTCAGEAGLSADADTTPGQHSYFIQANETNLAMLQRRAAAYGFLLYVDGTKLCFKAPASTAQVSVVLGSDLSVFRPRISATGYLEKTMVRGWDPQQKQAVVGESQKSKIPPKVGVAPKDYLSLKPIDRVADLGVQNQDMAKRVAQAVTDAHISRFVEADGISIGIPTLKAGVSLQVKGVGTRFSGTYLVTSATHSLLPGASYTTEFSVTGLNPTSVLGALGPSAHVQQPLGPLTIGIVTQNKDPEHLGRIKVKLPLLLDEKTSQEMQTDWVPLVVAGGGAQRGMLFIPEVNDEVLVGFGQGDINLPFVIGVLWNGKDKAPGNKDKLVGGDGKVNQRVIYSRTGHYIQLDDSDADGGISIIDKNNNKIVLKAKDNSLTIETAGDVKLTTKGNLNMDVTGNASLKAKGNLALEATGNVSLKATGNLTAEATGQADLKGTAGTKVESTAIVTVQGSMINLN